MNGITHNEALHGLERDKHAPAHMPPTHNMRYGIIHGAFYHMATAFADPYAIIPLFLAGFTESAMLIGLIVSLLSALNVVPQLSIAHRLQRHPDAAKPLMLMGIWLRCGVWGLIALSALFVPDPGNGMLLLFALLVSLYSLGGGIAVLPFKQVISQTISLERRSSFFGWRLITGGILAVLAGGIIKIILSKETLLWPQNYGLLFLFSFLSLLIAYIAMSRFQFVPQESTIPESSFNAQIRQLVHDYPVLKRLVLVRLLSGGLPLAFPFLILYATREWGICLGRERHECDACGVQWIYSGAGCATNTSLAICYGGHFVDALVFYAYAGRMADRSLRLSIRVADWRNNVAGCTATGVHALRAATA